jgi:16S rRNA (guanine527-N7)-methyltransferase
VPGTPASAAPIEAVPAHAAELFAGRLPLASRFAALLVTDGVARGLLGPRESGRIWSRHVSNCAAVTDLIPSGDRVVDVGSGAGLPGLVVAIRRPDLRVDLVEPMQRRVDFLVDAVAELGLADQVRVVRGRAEDVDVIRAVGAACAVTARAVAPLDRLVAWCLPLLEPGGRFVLIKGRSAADEVERHRGALRRSGARDVRVVRCGTDLIEPPTTVVVGRARETR